MRIGIDTGGTFTDAALIDAAGCVLATAKSPTTHRNLIEGVSKALGLVLGVAEADLGVLRKDVTSVALSTTLATNAMVEGAGSGAALILVGFDDGAFSRVEGTGQADLVVRLGGGHDAQGRELLPLDRDGLARHLDQLAKVSAVAVAAMFAVRNDAHETLVRSLVGADPRTGAIPVTCSHELSGRLHGPRRAATALANAVLTAPVRRLLVAFEESVRGAGIDAPLVVVRSDGSVMSLAHAMERPVETILSGPAASLLGGIHLAGVADAVVIDIGGTTTDVAVVSNRIPEVVDDGATVGGVGTMIRSPRITTEGLGGDSHVAWDEQQNELQIGPGRVTPLGVAQVRYPQITELLQAQRSRRIVAETDGTFFVQPDGTLVQATGGYRTRRDFLTARREAITGQLELVAMTPTDAAAATGLISTNELGDRFDVAASIAGLELFAATLDRYGEPRYGVADQAGAAIVREVQQRSGQVIAAAVGLPAPVWQSLLNDNDSYSVSVAIDRPIVGIGASSALYHPPLSRLLGVDVVIPEFSEVANAVGAAIGAVRFQMTASITAPKRAGFVLHRPGATVSFDSLEDAVAQAEERLEHHLRSRYETSGIASEAVPVSVSITRHDNVVNIDGAEFFVECVLEGTLTHDVGTNRSAESS